MKNLKCWIFLLLACGVNIVYAAQPIETWVLPNGARVLLVENHSLPILDISLSFDGGTRRDPIGKSGVAVMVRSMLARGVGAALTEPALNEAQISDAIADIAARIGGGVGNDRSSLSLRTLSSTAQRDAAILLAARMLAHPAFPEDILIREKTRAAAAIMEADVKPATIAGKAFAGALYGAHPYGRKATTDSVGSITRDDLAAFHRQYYVASGAVIAIVGDATREQADAFARQLTQRLPMAAAPLPALPEVVVAPAREERITHPATQAHILIGMPALQRGDPDYFALMVGNYILGGGGFVSRLVNEVREKRGLSYSVGSSFDPLKQPGPFRISLQTKKAQADEALKVVRATLAEFLQHGPTEAEMKAARDHLIGGFALNIDTNSKMLETLAVIGYYGLPLDYLDTWKQNVAKVTAADVRAAFQRKLALEKMSTVMVGASE